MLRRPPGEGRLVAQQRKVLLALAFILLPWLPIIDAQQQQRQEQSSPQHAPIAAHILNDDQGRHVSQPTHDSSPFEEGQAVENLVATSPKTAIHHTRAAPKSGREKYMTSQKQQKPFENIHIPHDASALATLAPAQPVRAPISHRQLPSLLAGAGLSSPQSARSLENWEVEDFVLLATIDGDLYAVNRTSGEERWHLQVEQPVVETIQHKINTSATNGGDDNHHPLDDYIWAVEPTRHGALYVWTHSGLTSGLMSTGFTMKQLVDDLGPYAVQSPPVVYTGHKKTTMITLDAATGRVFKWFGQSGSQVDGTAACYRPDGNLVEADNDECSNSGTITLSRTEYTVTIHHLDDGRPIATLKYSEWGPNNSDYDLHQQYRAAHRDRYITSKTDGKLFALDPSGLSPLVLQSSNPVAHVFDIARPEDTPTGGNPELVVLPQPAPPSWDDDSANARSHRVFLNQTESGSWYAMSGVWYPLVLEAPTARINRRNWWDAENVWNMLDEEEMNDALVGTHTLGNVKNMVHRPPSLPASLPSSSYPGSHNIDPRENFSAPPSPIPEPDYPTIVDKVIALPQKARDSAIELMVNPISITIILGLATFKLRDMIHKWKRKRSRKDYLDSRSHLDTNEHIETTVRDTSVAPNERIAEGVKVGPLTEGGVDDKRADAGIPAAPPEPVHDDAEREREQSLLEAESPEKKPKKAHRGRRGGIKHRKGMKKQMDNADSGSPDIDDAIPGIRNVGIPPKLEPNVITLKSNPEDVSGPVVEIGGIEVNQDDQLGMGSNGTVVFAGKFHGRDVAVKRMLTQFWDIATQETQLLLESDHHPNVIRYFAMSRNESFLYIALELCQASLSDIIDKPHMFQELARAGEMDLPHVLLQIANGLSFLHDLRIVHRDLKPQNILVTMGRGNKPRLLVSDFGLCKKLEGGQSSFGATTAHAAGTSGWRAPELLIDDDARENGGTGSMSIASTHSDSSSQLVSADVMPNRRATRSIDIFSLGLVFFYVLTKGSHPFDCGDRYMREVNIRKGQFNLAPLDMLGDVAYEAKALIETMLRADPRARPSAKDVMAHPFFWSSKEKLAFLCDVSDHFELEQRDPPSDALAELEHWAPKVCRGDFLKALPKEFVDSLGKQRKYTGSRMLDLLRALRNKRMHYGDMSESLKRLVGPLPEGYLGFWTRRFPNLLIVCCQVVYAVRLQDSDTFREYFKARSPL